MIEKITDWMLELWEDSPVLYIILCYIAGFIFGGVLTLMWYGVIVLIDKIFKTNLRTYFFR